MVVLVAAAVVVHVLAYHCQNMDREQIMVSGATGRYNGGRVDVLWAAREKWRARGVRGSEDEGL